MTAQQFFDLPLQRELDPAARTYYAQAEATAHADLGEAAFAAAWAEGHSLTPTKRWLPPKRRRWFAHRTGLPPR